MVNRGGARGEQANSGLGLVTQEELSSNRLSSLSIAMLSVLCYILLGVIFFCGREGYTFIDAAYFSTITLMTIGTHYHYFFTTMTIRKCYHSNSSSMRHSKDTATFILQTQWKENSLLSSVSWVLV
jgi:Ion channel